MTCEELYRLQVSAAAALLLSAVRRGMIDMTRNGSGPAATDPGPMGDHAVHTVQQSLT